MKAMRRFEQLLIPARDERGVVLVITLLVLVLLSLLGLSLMNASLSEKTIS
ncbi:MAG: pilus assembly protein PilX, partial [candidate division NC10 bacterium]|nr:pilus assembly protein PilX [candidate division NC10 bacterium]